MATSTNSSKLPCHITSQSSSRIKATTRRNTEGIAATFQARIAEGRRRLILAGVSEADAFLDAEVLARHILRWDRAALLTRGRETATAEFVERFTSALSRRAAREPVALITGHREFWGLDLEVTPDVLIPRPETEMIVEAALEIIDVSHCRRVVDVGTGSGCLAVALATEFPAARVLATDISRAALAVAHRNARRHLVDERVHFAQINLLEAIRGPVDLIVSNPPYVADSAKLPRNVVDYEPASALFGGSDGLAALRPLIATAGSRLADGGAFIVEFGFDQAERIRTLAHAAGWRIALKKDLQGIERVAVMKR